MSVPGTIFGPRLRFTRDLEWEDKLLVAVMRSGAEYARCYRATVLDGLIGVIVAREPAANDGSIIWHLSISHTAGPNTFIRCPTWDEMKQARYTFLPRTIDVSLWFPALSEGHPWLNDHPTTLHLWEDICHVQALR